MRIKEVMTGQVQCCSPDTNLAAAIEIMWNNDCGVLPVVDDGKLAGIVTDRDICIALGTRDSPARDVPVRDVGTTTVETCEPDDDVYAALEVMQTSRVRRLPVVDRQGNLLGIVTLGDLANRIEREDGSALVEELLAALKAVSSRGLRRPAASASADTMEAGMLSMSMAS
jgi:CBS domain-containing protein